MLLSHFSMEPPRDLYSCRCKAVTRRPGKEVYLLVVQMRRADVNAPGGHRMLDGGNPSNIQTGLYVRRFAYFLNCRSARICEVVSKFSSQFHANFHNAASNL